MSFLEFLSTITTMCFAVFCLKVEQSSIVYCHKGHIFIRSFSDMYMYLAGSYPDLSTQSRALSSCEEAGDL